MEIITNNPDVCAKYPGVSRFVQGGVKEVFFDVRNAVHRGARVLSHPLSGSVKPWESPYKSIALHPGAAALHFASLQLIEDAITILAGRGPFTIHYNESILADFRILDLDLIKSAMEGSVCTIS